MTKNELMAIVASGAARECFTHSVLGHFDVSATRGHCLIHGKLRNVELAALIEHIIKNRVFEEERVISLPASSWQADPGIILVCPEPKDQFSHCIMDGTHRALRRHREGKETMQFYIIPLHEAVRLGDCDVVLTNVWGDDLVDGKIVKRSKV